MRMRSMIAATVLLAGCGLAAAAQAETAAPFLGRWHWNRTESTAAPGEPLPKDVVLDITSAEPSHLEWKVTTVDEQGASHVESFNGAANGKPAPLQGSPDGTTIAVTLAGTTLNATYTAPDGSSDHESCSVSADRKKMTCRGTETDGKGHSANYTDVYDRQ